MEELKNTYGKRTWDRDRDNNPYGGGVLQTERCGSAGTLVRWLTIEFKAGDVLVFHDVHSALFARQYIAAGSAQHGFALSTRLRSCGR